MRRPRLLLTGFGPFPGAPSNPTAAVVERLVARADLAGRVEIVGRTLPVTWAAIDGFAATIAATAPDAVLMLGLARRAREVRVETRARNRALVCAVDADGRRSVSGRLDPAAGALRPVRAPTRAMAAAVAAQGLPVALGADAGAYLCNGLLWRALACGTRPTAFLHLPPTLALTPASRFHLVDLEVAVRAALAAFVAAIRPS